eukprot:1024507-Pleurochrysis_carterae.AAC.3
MLAVLAVTLVCRYYAESCIYWRKKAYSAILTFPETSGSVEWCAEEAWVRRSSDDIWHAYLYVQKYIF